MPPSAATGRSAFRRNSSARECYRRCLRLEPLEDRRVLAGGSLAWGPVESPVVSVAGPTTLPFDTIGEPLIATSQVESASAIEGEWIVRYGTATATANHTESKLGSSMLAAARRAGVNATILSLTAEGLALLRAPGATASEVALWVALDPSIATVCPNFIYQLHLLPDDPALDFDNPGHTWSEVLWGLKNEGEEGLVVGSYAPDSIQAGLVDVDIDAPEAWDLSTGNQQVVLAVIDSGVDYTHPDLAGNIWENPRDPLGDFDGDGNPDDDGNGFVDDVRGWDFVGDNYNDRIHDNDPADQLGHGTHVAGIIGAVGNNGVGVVGVNWNVSLLPLKIADRNGMISTAAAIEALDYLVRLKSAGVNVAAANASWGNSFGVVDAALDQAIGRLNAHGICFIASAGNDSHYRAGYPASSTQPNVISVAALNRENQLAFFSNFNNVEIDLAAPGDAILSTYPNERYEVHSGTSMAAPYVTGVVGLLAAESLTLAAFQANQFHDSAASIHAIKDALYEGVVLNANLAGKVATGGNLNALNSLQAFRHEGPVVRDLSILRTTLSTDQLVVDFSQEILAGSISAASVCVMSAGSDGIPGSSDDVLIPPSGVSLVTPLRARLTFASALEIGWHRLVLEADGVGVHGNLVSPVRSLMEVPIYDGADFVFDFEVAPVPGMFEPNDWLNLATDTGIRGDGSFVTTAIYPSPTIGDGLQPGFDVDFFSFVVPRRSIVDVSVTPWSSSDLDPLLRLFDGDGRELLMIDDAIGTESSLTVALSDPGTYYVAVSAFGNSDYDPNHCADFNRTLTSGAYELNLSVTADLLEARCVSGRVRHELAAYDASEALTGPPLTGWMVFVDVNENGVFDSADLSSQTMSDGRYYFDGLAAKTYDIGLVPQPGWHATTSTLQNVDLNNVTSAFVDFAARVDTSQMDAFCVTSALDRLSNTAISSAVIGLGLSLREAIQLASWYPELPTVLISANIPRITMLKGQFQIENSELVIRGSDELDLVQIDGNRQDRVFFVFPDAALTLCNVALTNGFAPRVTMPASLAETQGGAIFNAGAVSLRNVHVSQNEAGEDGGGLYNSFGADMTLDHAFVSENVARSLRSQRIELELLFNGELMPFTFTTGGGGGITNHGELYLRNGSVVDRNTSGREGGGIYVGKSGSLDSARSSILGNLAAAGGGGGIFAYAHGTQTATPQLLLLNDTVVANNRANAPRSCSCFIIAGGGGGGVLATELDETNDWTFNASVDLVGATVSDNKAHDGGGGLFVVASRLRLESSLVHGNTIEIGNGGGLYVKAITAALDTVAISENVVAPHGHGGGLYFAANGELEIANSQFVGNRLKIEPTLLNGGGGQGGGLYARSGTIVISNSLFDSNVSVLDGGGIRNYGGDMVVLNTTLSNNSTSLNFNNLWGRGGGISSGINLDQGFSRILVVNSTISGNVAAGKAGGVTLRNAETIPIHVHPLRQILKHSGVIHNSIVAGNFTSSAQGRTPDDAFGPTWDQSSSHNVFGTLAVSSPLAHGEGTLAGTWAAPVDARLQPLADNGGPTRTHALLPTSPAVDLASDKIALQLGLRSDQRGFTRFLDGDGDGLARSDAGAYEWVRGDLDGNGTLSASDIDILCQHFGDAEYDLNGNGLTGSDDLDTMVHDILHTEHGDANLDRVVDGADFILWNAYKFLAGGWREGDFNGNREVDQSDFLVWLSHFGWSGDQARGGSGRSVNQAVDHPAAAADRSHLDERPGDSSEMGLATLPSSEALRISERHLPTHAWPSFYHAVRSQSRHDAHRGSPTGLSMHAWELLPETGVTRVSRQFRGLT